jgi:hypothetical protein
MGNTEVIIDIRVSPSSRSHVLSAVSAAQLDAGGSRLLDRKSDATSRSTASHLPLNSLVWVMSWQRRML